MKLNAKISARNNTNHNPTKRKQDYPSRKESRLQDNNAWLRGFGPRIRLSRWIKTQVDLIDDYLRILKKNESKKNKLLKAKTGVSGTERLKKQDERRREHFESRKEIKTREITLEKKEEVMNADFLWRPTASWKCNSMQSRWKKPKASLVLFCIWDFEKRWVDEGENGMNEWY